MFNGESARLVGAGRVDPDPMWQVRSHSHSFWEFIYFLKGTGRIDTPQATIRPQQYHLIVYPPGLPHEEASDPVEPEQTIFLCVEIPETPPVGAHILLPDPAGELGWLCQHILAEYAALGNTPLAHAYTIAFLHLVQRVREQGLAVKHDAVDIAVQFIHTNYSKDITLDDLAKAGCVSKTHLSHCFHHQLEVSPLRYLQQVRIEAAKRLLLTTTAPINQIADEVGFRDPLYFSRVIRSSTGYSPTAYRNKNSAS